MEKEGIRGDWEKEIIISSTVIKGSRYKSWDKVGEYLSCIR